MAAPLLLALLALGCGSEESISSEPAATAPAASEFPSAKGKTLADIEGEYSQSDLVAAPTVQVFEPGKNRYAFGLFTVSREPVADGKVAIYVAEGPNGEAQGPYPAVSASLETKPAFAALTTTGDPDAATHVYTTDVDMPADGEWRVLAVVEGENGEYEWTRTPSAVVGTGGAIPDVGDKAPKIHTPTVEDVGGDISSIETRQPPDTQHEQDFADVVGKEPIVLSFATPALCSSRVCGPVIDIAEEVKSQRPDDASFFHMEIFEENTPPDVTEQVAAYKLRTEPWLFVIDENGKITERIEGAYGKAELEAAIDEVS